MAMIAKGLSASFAVRSVALEVPGTTADLSTCGAEARVRIRRSTGGRTTMSNLPPGRAILGSIKPAVRRHRGADGAEIIHDDVTPPLAWTMARAC